VFAALLLPQAEAGSLPRPGVSGDADKLLELVSGLAGKQSDKVEVDEALLRKFASGAYDVSCGVFCRQCFLAGAGIGRRYLWVTGCCTSCSTQQIFPQLGACTRLYARSSTWKQTNVHTDLLPDVKPLLLQAPAAS
jgi:hypothetical protein